ncbi:homoserine O-acetyltransferase [Xylona heveae TC161]|uniref:Homoserine O-acetyltransferase n=1 Tax=Xylona heveae (strain CBS 132557 / TC161) TaxID=1328760 RepID=A0A165H062_XYLHT|nr:homoserine O-acetyltransferase [Xylona heveae TC161]KZF22821.1 homoserine O-acetyltransferase [Xylona heveae TC161]
MATSTPEAGAPLNGAATAPPEGYRRISSQPENPFATLIPHQNIVVIPSFTLESGVTLRNVPVAYTTRGKLSPNRDNAMIICHALTGSADVADWWGPLMGKGRAFDASRFFIVCLNSLGSPYGTASPVTNKDGDPSLGRYGPEFPLTTIRDDVNLHKLILDSLGVKQLAAVVGGSMGGMLVLEWAYFGKDYVRCIVPIATSSQHSAWGISWGEAQRQSIYCDPKYDDGYYPFEDPPTAGLGAARMSALLTYRSRNSFESRFGRNTPDPSRRQNINEQPRPPTPSNEHWAVHNEGHKNRRSPRQSSVSLSSDEHRAALASTTSTPASTSSASASASAASIHTASSTPTPVPTPGAAATTINGTSDTSSSHPLTNFTDPQFSGATTFTPPPPLSTSNSSSSLSTNPRKRAATYFSAQSYLRYQGDKFVKRFDSNCYIAITRKLDTHDVSRYRVDPSSPNPVGDALALIQQPALVIGIESDGLFTFAEQQELAASIPKARLRTIDSPEGHDAFLLQFEQVNHHILDFFGDVLPDIMTSAPIDPDYRDEDDVDDVDAEAATGEQSGVGKLKKSSTFGEAEVDDITSW